MVEVNMVYQGGLRCESTHKPSGNTILTDAPVDNKGKGEAFSPTDLLATSFGTCILTIMGIAADAKDLDISGTKAKVQKEMTQTPPRRVAKLTIDIYVPINEGHEAVAALERAAHTCPVHFSLHPDIDKIINFHWEG